MAAAVKVNGLPEKNVPVPEELVAHVQVQVSVGGGPSRHVLPVLLRLQPWLSSVSSRLRLQQ